MNGGSKMYNKTKAARGNQKKAIQLGMSYGSAIHRLRKMLLFKLIQDTQQDLCFQCGKKIETVAELSIEHKYPWLDSINPEELFFDLNNIAFSHLSCNCGAARHPKCSIIHGVKGWRRGCRCLICLAAKNNEKKRYREQKRGS